ncbi:MAG: bifunctional aldolase/short-chain dehydrogenase [Chloroflexi bacterium]|nr:MAG: bifunctional rhamnulose-1-phosphate aldolase/short-chain dehydrogenase [Phototrophicales bacterium]RMF79668.1 MAG: bifunctional aldolase/short-chain dehydrogenase [Chloroflexota bacterium]
MPENLWNDSDANNLPDLDGLVYRSNLLGQDRRVVNIYGGNTSAKLTMTDHVGRRIDVLAVKASGSDVLTITEPQFALLKLEEIYPLFERDAMTDEEMVDYLARTVFEPGRPRQSIETLLHAFVPYKHVDHTHPDAIISIACTKDAEQQARAVFGDRMAYVPYIKPGFTLSKWIGSKVRDNPNIECVVMGKHGLVTWGDDSKSAYDTSIRIIQEAEDYIADKRKGKKVFGDLKVQPLSVEERENVFAEVLPVIRGAVSAERSAILQIDSSDTVLNMVGGAKTSEVSQLGVACPDHLVHVKRQPLFIDWQPSEGVKVLTEKIRDGIADYKQRYAQYFEENKVPGDEIRDTSPRVILIPGVGMVNTGKDVKNADVSRQLYHRAIQVIGDSEALGGFVSLTPKEAYDIEYWPLELYKLKLAPPDRDFAGKVVLITGAASGIGRETAYRLAEDGAHIVIADINDEGGEETKTEVEKRHGKGRALFVHTDVTDEVAVQNALRQTVLAYGGLDVLINNAGIAGGASIEDTSLAMWQRNIDILATGYFLMAREAFKVMKRQGTGGTMVFVSSKNGIMASKGAVAYSTAKAAELHMARSLAEEVGAYGIRVNSVLPDAVIRGSSIWDAGWKEARAKQYGIDVEDLSDFYRQRNTLKVEILPEDLAEAIAFLAGPRSAKTTGAVLTVDGGVAAAYVR